MTRSSGYVQRFDTADPVEPARACPRAERLEPPGEEEGPEVWAS